VSSLLFESLAGIADRAERSIGCVEAELHRAGVRWILGVDEAGRGPLAGPVTTAAVLMPCSAVDEWRSAGLDDSKKLSPEVRERLECQIRSTLIYAVVDMSPTEVDELNVLQASLEGMRRALKIINAPAAVGVLVDGNRAIRALGREQATLVKGDSRSLAIAAASVLAKEHRDRHMRQLSARFPAYGFEHHKGYPTPAHLAALAEVGPCVEHRRTFAPVRKFFQGGS
jgi:ribonuclease HII